MTQRELDKAYEKFITQYRGRIKFAIDQEKQKYQSKADLSFLHNDTATYLAAFSAFGGTGYFAYRFFKWEEYWLVALAVAMLLVFAWFALDRSGNKDRISSYFFEHYNCRWDIVRSCIENIRKDHLYHIDLTLKDPETLLYRVEDETWEQDAALARAQKKECNEIFDHILHKAEYDVWWRYNVL